MPKEKSQKGSEKALKQTKEILVGAKAIMQKTFPNVDPKSKDFRIGTFVIFKGALPLLFSKKEDKSDA